MARGVVTEVLLGGPLHPDLFESTIRHNPELPVRKFLDYLFPWRWFAAPRCPKCEERLTYVRTRVTGLLIARIITRTEYLVLRCLPCDYQHLLQYKVCDPY